MYLRALTITALLSVSISASQAKAQVTVVDQTAVEQEVEPSDEQLNLARKKFGEGVAAANQNNFPLAIRRFRAAREIKDAPAVRYNLAAALSRSGKKLEAAQLAESVMYDAESPDNLKQQATELRTNLASRVAAIHVNLVGSTQPTDTTLDAQAVKLDRDVAVSEGTHVVQVVRGSTILAKQDVEAIVGQVRRVSLNVLSVEAAAQSAVPEPDPVSETKPLYKDWRFWAVVGAAVVLIVIVSIAVAASSGSADPIEGNFTPGVLQW